MGRRGCAPAGQPGVAGKPPLLEGPGLNHGPMPLLWDMAEYISKQESGRITTWQYPIGPVRWRRPSGRHGKGYERP